MEATKRDSPSSGQPAKRLKQACLQFKNVGVRSIGNCSPQKIARKRPLSCSEEDVKNTSKSVTEDDMPNAWSNKTLGICKENQGPSRSKNKSDTLKKNKSNKKQTAELKPADSAAAKNSDGSVPLIVDLSCDSIDELVETGLRNAKPHECVVNDPTIITLDVKNNKIQATQLSKETNAAEVENAKHTADTSSDQIGKQSATPIKSPNCETNDHIISCIESVIFSTSNANNETVARVNDETLQSGKSFNLTINTIPSRSDHIDECIDSVIKNSSSIEIASISVKGNVIQPKEPIRKKKLKKVSKSPSEELAKEREIQEKLKIQLETAKLRAELKRQRDEAKQQREKEKVEALAKKKKDEIEKLERLQLKEEERKKKEEALQAKSEEKLRKAKEKQERGDEKRKAEEEEQRKKNKVKAAFVSFFVKKDATQPILEPENVGSFRLSDNVQQAPLHRNCRNNTTELVQALDSALEAQTCLLLYLEQLKKKEIAPGKSHKLPSVEKDVEIIECNGEVECHRKRMCKAKLLQFSENVRPPYWGTWRKRSKVIRSRTPFGKDEKVFDYEIDSEAEWEEEEPGESLSNSEGEKESDDDYEVDNEFFVPHGYLSEEEDQDGAEMSPADFKEQLKFKQKEFEIERKRKCQQLKPVLLGCFWMTDDQSGNEEVINVLEEYTAVLLTPGSIDTRYSVWLAASVHLPQKTPSPNSSYVGSSPPSSQTQFDKSVIQRLHFTPKSAKPALCENIGDYSVIDLTDDAALGKPMTPGNG